MVGLAGIAPAGLFYFSKSLVPGGVKILTVLGGANILWGI
jgi:hypothetical protein